MNKFFTFTAIAAFSIMPAAAAPQAIFCEHSSNAGMAALQWSSDRSLGLDTETMSPGCRALTGQMKIFAEQLFLADFVGAAIDPSAIATVYEVVVYPTINGYVVFPLPPKQVVAE